jgi:cadmium resistance protein CadD (predicted permease)
VLRVVLVMTGVFFGTMLDNAFAFAAQLVVSPRTQHRRLGVAQWWGVVGLVGVSLAVGTVLAVLPLHAVAVLAVAPLAFAVHAWRRPPEVRATPRRGALTTILVTIALGGDNVAVWSPLLRVATGWYRITAVATLLLLDALLVLVARAFAGHPAVVATGQRVSTRALPLLYLTLAVVVLAECGWW